MPTRRIDGDAVLNSDKIGNCKTMVPASTGVYYPLFHTFADANGNFEVSVHAIHAKCLLNFPFLTAEHIHTILDEFHREGLLFLWQENGKQYGYWTKSDKPGRLPTIGERERFKNIKVNRPTEGLAKYETDHQFTSNRDVIAMLSRTGSSSCSGSSVGSSSCSSAGAGRETTAAAPQTLDLKAQIQETAAAPAVADADFEQIKETEADRQLPLSDTAPTVDGAAELLWNSPHLKITKEQHEKLQKAYPGLTAATHYAQMEVWLDANPERRRKNHYAFAQNWLAKEQRDREARGSGNGSYSANSKPAGAVHKPTGKQYREPTVVKV